MLLVKLLLLSLFILHTQPCARKSTEIQADFGPRVACSQVVERKAMEAKEKGRLFS